MKTIYLYLRRIIKVISYFMESSIISNPLTRGEIEIDEAVITSRRKGLIGRFPNAILWIFGLYSRENRFGYIFPVSNRQSDSLIPLIDQFVTNGSTIYSDEFSTYVTRTGQSRIIRLLDHKRLQHYWVNHSISFVNPLDHNINTNHIERMWRSLRKKICRNIRIEYIEDYLNLFIFLKMTPKQERYRSIMDILSKLDNFDVRFAD